MGVMQMRHAAMREPSRAAARLELAVGGRCCGGAPVESCCCSTCSTEERARREQQCASCSVRRCCGLHVRVVAALQCDGVSGGPRRTCRRRQICQSLPIGSVRHRKRRRVMERRRLRGGAADGAWRMVE